MCYDGKNLYLHVVCYEPFMDEVVNVNVERDTPVWREDCVELFINPGRTYSRMYEFEVGVEGGFVDVDNIFPTNFMDYNPEWLRAVRKFADRWGNGDGRAVEGESRPTRPKPATCGCATSSASGPAARAGRLSAWCWE